MCLGIVVNCSPIESGYVNEVFAGIARIRNAHNSVICRERVTSDSLLEGDLCALVLIFICI